MTTMTEKEKAVILRMQDVFYAMCGYGWDRTMDALRDLYREDVTVFGGNLFRAPDDQLKFIYFLKRDRETTFTIYGKVRKHGVMLFTEATEPE